MRNKKSILTFTLNPDEYYCRFGTIHMEGKTRYISNGTYIFWGCKTLLVSETIPQYTERTKPLVVKCTPMKFDDSYYDVKYIETDSAAYTYEGVAI